MSSSLSRRSDRLLEGRYLWVAAAALIAILLAGGFVGVPDAGAVSDPIQRGINWEAARDQALAAFYGAQADADIAQAAGWDAARDRALAAFYGSQADAGIAQAVDWDAARDRALAAFYGVQAGASIQRGIDADAARYQALGEFYLARSGGDVLAANPELMVARRYASSLRLDSSLLAANPELSLARRAASPGLGVCSPEGLELAADPEFATLRRSC